MTESVATGKEYTGEQGRFMPPVRGGVASPQQEREMYQKMYQHFHNVDPVFDLPDPDPTFFFLKFFC